MSEMPEVLIENSKITPGWIFGDLECCGGGFRPKGADSRCRDNPEDGKPDSL